MEKGLLEKTGRSLEDWIKLARKTKLDKYKAILDHLKTEHSLTHGYANLIALKTLGTDAASHDAGELVETQYKGKEILRPIYEGLLKQIGKFGNDITITPK
ncbi:MAG: DUF4287 domain-containing protein, partial [Chitinophagaceae bacterium]|nr:DUF4287 domain-containing protein [Chitinophagaceae bacterium]